MKVSFSAFADEMRKLAFATDARKLGIGGVKRPPFPTARSTSLKGVNQLNKPHGGSFFGGKNAPLPAP